MADSYVLTFEMTPELRDAMARLGRFLERDQGSILALAVATLDYCVRQEEAGNRIVIADGAGNVVREMTILGRDESA